MRHVLDASVAVAAVRSNEVGYAAARNLVQQILTEAAWTIVAPSIFPIEVLSALVRAKEDLAASKAYVRQLLARTELVTISAKRARKIMRTVERTGLRAADSLYVWVAEREQVPLYAFDNAILKATPLARKPT